MGFPAGLPVFLRCRGPCDGLERVLSPGWSWVPLLCAPMLMMFDHRYRLIGFGGAWVASRRFSISGYWLLSAEFGGLLDDFEFNRSSTGVSSGIES